MKTNQNLKTKIEATLRAGRKAIRDAINRPRVVSIPGAGYFIVKGNKSSTAYATFEEAKAALATTR
jgi:hypothetical protein